MDAKRKASLRLVVVTMDTHLASATAVAAAKLAKAMPGLTLEMHAASEYASDARALASCREAIQNADILFVSMLFLEDHFLPVIDLLEKRRDEVDAMVCAMSAAEVVRLTKVGRFDMSKPASGALAFLKRLRGSSKPGDSKDGSGSSGTASGARQMRMLRRLPKILRFIPGTAQDVRAYFLCLQYWLGGSEDNMVNLAAFLVNRYAKGPREVFRNSFKSVEPIEYPELGLYHPRLEGRITDRLAALPSVASRQAMPGRPRVGLLMLRSYLLAGNTGHYDGVIQAIEARGLSVVPAFAMGLDSRPAIEAFFMKNGKPSVDAVVSLTGFSLVGGPAYNDSQAAEEVLASLNLPYIAAHPLEFQTLAEWGGSSRGLLPVESTIMVAIPELDGATAPMVFGGRPGAKGVACKGCDRHCTFDNLVSTQDMVSCPDRAERLADRLVGLVSLRRRAVEQRRVAVVIFNFPPNGGSVGTAAHLSVFESVFNTLKAMQAEGYSLQLPKTAHELREALLNGNAAQQGTDANCLARIPVADYIERETYLADIEKVWGAAPGRQLTNGKEFFVLGLNLGDVALVVQPGFGYEGDPMRLLFEEGMAPTHAFAAFYRYLREDFKADAILHFGTHGALEFMPGKQAGSSGACWPERMIGPVPNFYLYASNNPSEGTIAKRRAAATLISHMTPPVGQAGLYAGLQELKATVDRWRSMPRDTPLEQWLESNGEAAGLVEVMVEQAKAVELTQVIPTLMVFAQGRNQTTTKVGAARDQEGPLAKTLQTLDEEVYALHKSLMECDQALIPQGLHVVGEPMSAPARRELLLAMAQAYAPLKTLPSLGEAIDALMQESPSQTLEAAPLGSKGLQTARRLLEPELGAEGLDTLLGILERVNRETQTDAEVAAILKALNGEFIRPAPGGDLLHTPEILPTGRNLHGFDPFRMPSRFAVSDGARQAERLLDRYKADGHGLPESVAMVLWGTDNLKTGGGPMAQALALMGAAPRFDSFGRLAGAQLMSLEELGRPRIDVVVTLSGIFRDLLPLQIRMLAEAAFLAASADEPTDQNFVRRHCLAYMAEHGCDLETAALRVFGNCDGAYGANVNHLIDQGCWNDEDELAEAYTKRKGFAYGRAGKPLKQPGLLQSVLKDVSLAYQNLDSIEIGVTSVDNYFDTLGGVSRAVRRAKQAGQVAVKAGQAPCETPVYIGDQTTGSGLVRSLSEQVALETRTRMLNPKWYEGMLDHGYEGVRQIEAHLTNTMGWSATTGQVQPWVYQQLTKTFVLDEAMRHRLAELNPKASAKLAGRLLEASERRYWSPDEKTLEALRRAGEELEDRIEGVYQGAAS
ncbi:MAG: magnesium chelatase subunit H [Burkholderiaceae bacterium]